MDWSRERFTMDDGCQEAVLSILLVCTKRPYLQRHGWWCPRCHTALSDIDEFADKADYGVPIWLKMARA